jgi:hypothetical protein
MESTRRAEVLSQFRGLERGEIDNPHLDEMRRKVGQFADGTLQHPDNALARFLASQGASPLDTWQSTLILQYGHQAPNDAALKLCAKYGPLLSLGAGRAYPESLLQRMGVRVLAVDNGSSSLPDAAAALLPPTPDFMFVLMGDERYVRDCPPGYNLLLWWPPPPILQPPMASKCLKVFREKYLLFAGEKNLAHGDLEFHWMLRNEWKMREEVELPGNIESDPRLSVYERDPEAEILTGSARECAIADFAQSAMWQAVIRLAEAKRGSLMF